MTVRDLDIREIMMLPMQENDADAKTIGQYIMILGATLFEEEESFSGKRPFGNSSWIYDAYIPLVKAGIIDGEIDEEFGWLNKVDDVAGAAVYQEIFDFLMDVDYTTIP